MAKPKIDDWVLVGNYKVGQLWDIRGKHGIVQVEQDGLMFSMSFPMAILTYIPKSIADIMRGV